MGAAWATKGAEAHLAYTEAGGDHGSPEFDSAVSDFFDHAETMMDGTASAYLLEGDDVCVECGNEDGEGYGDMPGNGLVECADDLADGDASVCLAEAEGAHVTSGVDGEDPHVPTNKYQYGNEVIEFMSSGVAEAEASVEPD